MISIAKNSLKVKEKKIGERGKNPCWDDQSRSKIRVIEFVCLWVVVV